jgi:ligand-binding sensor domain-containing protein
LDVRQKHDVDYAGGSWVASKGALVRYGQGQLERHVFQAESSVDQGAVTCLCEDRERNMWFGTERGGLHALRTRTIVTLDTGKGLPHDEVRAVCEAGDGSVWIGTDRGVCRWQNGRLTNFRESDEVIDDTVRALAEDQAGRLWIGTRRGLSCFAAGQFRSYRFGGEWFNSKGPCLARGS